jgi:hypothetical protein
MHGPFNRALQNIFKILVSIIYLGFFEKLHIFPDPGLSLVDSVCPQIMNQLVGIFLTIKHYLLKKSKTNKYPDTLPLNMSPA